MYRAVQKSDAFISNHSFRVGIRLGASAAGQGAAWPEASRDYRRTRNPRLAYPWSVFQRKAAKRRKRLEAFTEST
jgi:hypothetical protein